MKFYIFMARRASLRLLSNLLNLYNIYIFIDICTVYVFKEVASFQELGQLIAVVHNRAHAPAAGRKLLDKLYVAYVVTALAAEI